MAQELRQHQKEAEIAIAQSDKGIIELPTGTGKSMIQADAIVTAISVSDKGTGIYVIASPRILLSSQLLETVRDKLIEKHIDCQYLQVRSGKAKEFGEEQTLQYRELQATTDPREIQQWARIAANDGVPLVISAVYDSVGRIVEAGIPVNVMHCDEAHYLVEDKYSWIPTSDAWGKIFFYTATVRDGMQDDKKFGPIIYSRTPAEMVAAGEIVAPRMQVVNVSVPIKNGAAINPRVVGESFLSHAEQMKHLGAKLLVCTTGADQLAMLVGSSEMNQLVRGRPGLTVFDISSQHSPRINGNVVERDDFLEQLRGMDDDQEAIIFHIDILTEGIDVPGITGVMTFVEQGQPKFLQTLGRATRLNPEDRDRLYAGEIKPGELKKMIKPFAWVVVPLAGKINDEFAQETGHMVANMDSFDFDPFNHVATKEGPEYPLAPINQGRGPRADALTDMFGAIYDKDDAVRKAEKVVKEAIEHELKVRAILS